MSFDVFMISDHGEYVLSGCMDDDGSIESLSRRRTMSLYRPACFALLHLMDCGRPRAAEASCRRHFKVGGLVATAQLPCHPRCHLPLAGGIIDAGRRLVKIIDGLWASKIRRMPSLAGGSLSVFSDDLRVT